MPLTVSGDFIECFSSIDSCQATCSFGECFYVDVCNERHGEHYYCSAVSPYMAIFLSLAALFVIFVLCCGGFSFCMWNSMQKRRRQLANEPRQVLQQPLDQNLQYYHPRAGSRY